MNYYIKGATIVNEGWETKADVLVANGKIAKIVKEWESFEPGSATVIDASGKYLLPGVIDEHVHFREPGMTHKGDIYSESRAAVAGGVTSFMEMPNTNPPTTTHELLRQKFDLAAEKSLANYSFYLGATNDNLAEVAKTDPTKVCGIKLFMGSSTGNMLMDDPKALEQLFKESPCLIAAHCEDEEIIRNNTLRYKNLVYEGKVPNDASLHPLIRCAEACYKSSSKAVELAEKTGARLHVLHVSTEKELALFRKDIPLCDKKITAETCPQYLCFYDTHYQNLGFSLKCNPAIKTNRDRIALLQAVRDGVIDTMGSDHAPHLWEEKMTGDYFTAKSGMPGVENLLEMVMDVYFRRWFMLPRVVELLCHNPATLYHVDRRGFIREGYYADLVLVDFKGKTITDADMHSKCGWTPYSDINVDTRVTHTFVNGNLVYENGVFHEESRGKSLEFRVEN